jgi:hypothetical protein
LAAGTSCAVQGFVGFAIPVWVRRVVTMLNGVLP